MFNIGSMLDISHLQILFEDNHLIAVNKPAGWLVQGDQTGDTPLSEYVKTYIKMRYKKPGDVFLGVIHRLDRPVSGVVIFARTSKGLTRMNELFRTKEIGKHYYAITRQRPKPFEGKLVHYLIKNSKKNKASAYDKLGNRTKDAKKSITNYHLMGEIDKHFLIGVNPITGRPHQIRVQLSKIGCPIRGDVKYGFKNPNPDASINLHCHKLTFIHPIKKEPVTIEAELPQEHYWQMFAEVAESYQ